jgi:hypothetical protein
VPHPLRFRRALMGGAQYPNIAARFSGAAGSTAFIADNASLSMGAGARHTIAAWINVEVAAGTQIISKTNPSGIFEYALNNQVGVNGFQYRVSSTGTSFTNTLNATNFGTIPVGTWCFVVARYDGANLSLGVNAGTPNTQAFSADVSDQANDFRLGGDATGGSRTTCRLDCVGYWSRAITNAEVTQLYRSGVGMAYRDLDAALKTGLVSWWDLDNTLNDSHGSNHLTNGGLVTFTGGKR